MLLTALLVLLGLLLGAWALRHRRDGWRTCQQKNSRRSPSRPSQGAWDGPKRARNGAKHTTNMAGGGGSRPNTADGGPTAKLVALGLDLASESTAAAAAVLQRLIRELVWDMSATIAVCKVRRTASGRWLVLFSMPQDLARDVLELKSTWLALLEPGVTIDIPRPAAQLRRRALRRRARDPGQPAADSPAADSLQPPAPGGACLGLPLSEPSPPFAPLGVKPQPPPGSRPPAAQPRPAAPALPAPTPWNQPSPGGAHGTAAQLAAPLAPTAQAAAEETGQHYPPEQPPQEERPAAAEETADPGHPGEERPAIERRRRRPRPWQRPRPGRSRGQQCAQVVRSC